jgi:LuxR family quorum-sensing system transcriptional regulator CciR
VGLGVAGDLQEFIRQAQSLESMGGLQLMVESLVKDLGFRYYALTHHVAVLPAPAGVVRLHNYPDEWVETVVRRRYFTIDPVHIVSQRSATGFHWSEFSKFISLTGPQQVMQAEAKRAGIADGFTVPVNVPGEYTGSISYAVESGANFPHASLPVANFLGPIAFEAARRISGGASRQPDQAEVHLTTRQLDCVTLVAHGKSDVDIAAILGLSPATVRFHVDSARDRMQVATRTQLVVRALFGNLLTFADVLQAGAGAGLNSPAEPEAGEHPPLKLAR